MRERSQLLREKVLAIVSNIPRGKTMSYGAVAARAGKPNASRAVGAIMRANHDPRIPCHRVIRSNGQIGGYNRGGPLRKTQLLRREGVAEEVIFSRSRENYHRAYKHVTMQNTLHNTLLERTIALAVRGKDVFPNPRAGCVIVQRGRVIAEGWHHTFGGPHAEIVALEKIPKGAARGATVYVNLEPCVDWEGKKTPSCAKRLVREGVQRVVIGMRDPNPQVHGKGVTLLKRSRVTVDVAPPRRAVYDLNHAYLMRIVKESHERPFVLMKTAMSIDGKIGTPDHRSIALSTAEDRRAVDRLRAECDAIMVGGVTWRNDKPRLTVKDPALVRRRVAEGRDPQPLRVSVMHGTLIVGRDRYVSDRVNLARAMAILAIRYGVRLLLLEGGGELNFSMLHAGLVDLMRVATAPVVLGGRTAPTLVDGEGFARPLRLQKIAQTKEGEMDIAWYRL